jgi:hypothetical protein
MQIPGNGQANNRNEAFLIGKAFFACAAAATFERPRLIEDPGDDL